MGNPIAAAAHKPSDAKKPFKKRGDKQMAYLTATVKSSMKKGLKKAMKSPRSASVIALMTCPAAAIPIQNRKLGNTTQSM
jgi:hypothetical protein